jgi:hypothetical protein
MIPKFGKNGTAIEGKTERKNRLREQRQVLDMQTSGA